MSTFKNNNPNILSRIKQALLKNITYKRRRKINDFYKSTIIEKDLTIISSFCVAGTIYHDVGTKFLSPTINLAFDGEDFCAFCENLEENLKKDIIEVKNHDFDYPVGRLGDNVLIRFVHYDNFELAKSKWLERVQRINWSKIVVIANDRDGMDSNECLNRFDKLPYKKYMFSAKKRLYEWCIVCDVFKNKNTVGVLTGIANIKGQRFYEVYFDVVNLFNSFTKKGNII